MNFNEKIKERIKFYATLLSMLVFSLSGLVNASAEQEGKTNSSESAIDHKVLVVRTSHTYKAKSESLKDESIKQGIKVDSKPVSKLDDLDASAKLFGQYDLILFDGASKRETKKQFDKFAPVIAQSNKKFVALKWYDSESLTKNIGAKHAKQLFHYYDNGGAKNFARMATYLKNRVFTSNSTPVKEPVIYPEVGIYHPKYENLIFENLEDYEKWNDSRERKGGNLRQNSYKVGVMMQRALVESSQTYVVDAAINALEAKGATVIPFFFEVSPMSSPYQHMISKNGETIVDVIVNFRTIHWANKRKSEFEQLGVPIIQALTYFDGDQKQWEDDSHGIPIGMTSFLLVLPESAGVIDPQIIAARNHQTERSEVIDYQLEFFLDKAINQAKLATNPNKDKKLTVMFWGDRDMGASFMNVPESLHAISHRLEKEGYSIQGVEAEYFIARVNRILDPFYRDFELDELLDDDLAELLPVSDYKKWLATLPENVVKPINEKWGQPENNFMVVERDSQKYFVIPRIRNGNMLVLRQPPRGDSKDKEMGLYHDTKVPMNHYYMAAYFFAREYWNSDAFVHLGTHGTHEYLPGKDRGLSRYDGANLTTGSVPVVYPYIVDDVGEAMQAKRRGNAVIVSHMTPPFAAAGLQGVTADMHTLVDQYRHVDTGGVKEKTKQQIIEMCHKENLCKDLNYDQQTIDKSFDQFLSDLHSYLEELAAQNQPLGLHSFGELAEQRLIISTLGQMLGNDFLKVAADFEEGHYGHDQHDGHHHEEEHHDRENKRIEHSHDREGEKISDGLMHFIAEDLEATAGYKSIRDFVVSKGDPSELSDDIKPYIEQASKFYKDIVAIKELDNLVAGLSGKFIPPKNGGDPVRNPESLPTGFNLIGFDPARLPTKASWEQGKELAEDIINNYYKKHGQYPDKLAFSLWSVEAMRHYGVLESQALYAMGIRPVWSSDGRVIDTEIIPASELKRPRVDVVLSATGLYRDAFPNVMEMLAKAIKRLTELKEEGNSIWKNSQKVKQQLVAEGIDADEAEYLSSVRIFSNTFG
ncbi:MAG: cobaltochelatase subunit CobN, partial [Kangiellaceae bacterium]|nr:cobaltochelatase subunit CobN [Kangiellaceae bacterium]